MEPIRDDRFPAPLVPLRIHGLIAGKSDPLGQDRILESDKGRALAAHSTLNRLELSAEAIDARYHKIQAQPDEIEQFLIERGVKAIPRKSAEIVLDLPSAVFSVAMLFALSLESFMSSFGSKRPDRTASLFEMDKLPSANLCDPVFNFFLALVLD